MPKIPKPSGKKEKKVVPNNINIYTEDKKVLFSFEILERNDYFNLDGTCVNWSSDLFEALKKVSKITMKEIHAGNYSGKSSPFRIHRHDNAKPPCNVTGNISLEDLWQIRISLNKGGIHGLFIDNVFYVLWLDPQHNLYPNENRGGVVKITPPSTCCKERDAQIKDLYKQLEEYKENERFLNEYIAEIDNQNKQL